MLTRLVLAALIAGSVWRACGGGPLAAGTAAAEPVWRHGIIQPKSDAGFAVLPADPRFAGPEGIAISITPVQSDQVGLKALLAGDLDSFEGAPNSAIVAAAHGADIKIIGCAWPQLVHGIFVRDDIRTLADLRGKNVAISAPGSMPDFLIRAALKKAGLSPSDVHFASLGSDTDRFKALSAGVVSGAVISSEYIPLAPAGVRPHLSAPERAPEVLRGCVVPPRARRARRRDDAVRFMAAEMAGVRHAAADKADELAATRKAARMEDSDPRPGFLFDQAVSLHEVDGDMPLPADKIAWLQDLIVATAILRSGVDVNTMLDPTVRADALKRLGTPGG